ncbi:MAG: 50S ribosomal protein L11 methyltransferase [Betaproteobacteria bacterium]|nr:50S ribosomal protein L11 methyltransferase [Betaproteobacteria bacterium]
MAWLSLKIEADEQTAGVLSDVLLDLGALSADIEDANAETAREQPIFGEPGEPTDSLWKDSIVSGLFAEDADIPAIVAAATEAAHLDTVPRYRVDHVAEQDWVRLTQSQFDPIQISPRLWIIPTWHTPVDAAAINLILDPGLAFGTGSHPTTHLCLQWLERNLRGGESVLDYGCGSGILAIAALKLGAAKALGVDIDPQAVLASKQNAEQNQAAADFFLPGDAPKIQADIVVSNILANPLKVLSPMLAQAVRPGGQIVLSGVLAHQAEETLNVYRQWFDIDIAAEMDGWVCLAGVKR